jgi:chemotaxis protein histidine kinase CheA
MGKIKITTMDLSQFKQKFIEEANTSLVNLDNALLELEKDPSNKQFIDESFRVMHTIKGASGMYGFDQVVEVTHELESLFDIVRENKIVVPQQLIEVTFEAADHIRSLLIDEEFANMENIQRHGALRTNIEVIKLGFKLPKNEETASINFNLNTITVAQLLHGTYCSILMMNSSGALSTLFTHFKTFFNLVIIE